MLEHNILLFFRNLKKHRGTFLINILGMSIGLASTILIAIWVIDELQVDNFHERGDQLVQILQNIPTPDGIETSQSTQGPLAEALLEEFPEIEQTVSVLGYDWFEGEKFLLSDGDERLFSSRNQFASPDYFSVFSFPLLHGNSDTALESVNAVVISEEMAKKLFKTTNAVDKTIEWLHDEFGGTYTVTGVFKTLPQTSSVQFDAAFNIEVFIAQNEDLKEWRDSDVYTYSVLKPNTDLQVFNSKIKNFLRTKNEYSPETYFAQVYSNQYLYGNYENGQVAGGRVEYVRLLTIIAFLILIIACVNFINMTTAQASTRLREIGIKKSIGAKRGNLRSQFLAESLLTATISMLLALVIVGLLIPEFNKITGKQLSLSFDMNLAISVLAITLFTGFLGGTYPAIYMSGLAAINGLKGKLYSAGGDHFVRKSLVVFQFVISVILITSVFIVYKQMAFIQHKNLGYNKDNVIWFPLGILESKQGKNAESKGINEVEIEQFLKILKNTPGVVNTANFRHTMMADFGTTTGVDWPGKSSELDALFAQISGGYDFIETMEIEMKEGRSFSREYKTDTDKIIFNEAAIAKMGLQNPVGKTISLWGEEREIIGVTKDFHVDLLYKKVIPVFMKLDSNRWSSNVMVRIKAEGQAGTLERLNKAYSDYFIEGMPFEFRFLDEDYQMLYESEQKVASLSKYFALLATLISCLGLFGLAVFTMRRRRKEISIRKVLGQTTPQITIMLSGEFTKLVLLAIGIALPLAYLLTTHWLSGFAYKVQLQFWYFFGSGFIALIIALLTVGSLALKAANSNPVNALREE